MASAITVLGAPSAIGIRPYDDGTPRHLDRAPGVLRALGLVSRLGARDAGDVVPPPYRDLVRPGLRPRNEPEMVAYSHALALAVSREVRPDRFVVVLGGDCSILLGCLLGARGGGPLGLAYLDAHADFAVPEVSRTGSVASMDLALAVGRGATPLAGLGGSGPLVREQDVVVIGRRDQTDERYFGDQVLGNSAVHDIPADLLAHNGPQATAAAALSRIARPDLAGFWVHLDVDLLNPLVMPAVDSPETGGPDFEALAELLAPLVRHPLALGMNVTIYDPTLDQDFAAGRKLVTLLEGALRPRPATIAAESPLR
jgi:arginase